MTEQDMTDALGELIEKWPQDGETSMTSEERQGMIDALVEVVEGWSKERLLNYGKIHSLFTFAAMDAEQLEIAWKETFSEEIIH